MDRKELFRKVKGTKFFGMSEFKPIMIHLLGLEEYPSILHSFLKIIYSALCLRYEFECKKNDVHLFVFSNSYMTRSDYLKGFNAVTSSVPNAAKIVAVRKWHLSFSHIISLCKIFVWNTQLKGINAKTKIFILSQLYEGYISLKEIARKADGKLFRTCTTYCDTHLTDSLVEQYFNAKGITTITLQHGHFANVPEVNGYSTSVHFSECTSKYMITFGDYTNDQAVMCGMKREQLYAAGMPQYIGKISKSEPTHKGNGCFGVILSFEKEKENNIKMLKIAAEFAEVTKLRYIVRFHPSNSHMVYEQYIHKIYGTDKEYEMTDFMDRVDFLLVGKSTMFIEAIYDLKCAFIFAPGIDEDAFPGIDWCKFGNINELIGKYNSLMTNEKQLDGAIKRTREYLCPSDDIAANYINFYKKFS